MDNAIGNIADIGHEKIVFSSKEYSCKGRNGIYFLILDNRIVYVGQSQNVFRRSLTGHADKKFDSINYITVNKNQRLNNLEAYFIAKFKPAQNRSIPSNTLGISKKHLIEDFNLNRVKHEINEEYGKFSFEDMNFVKSDNPNNLHLIQEEYDYTNVKTRSLEFKIEEAENRFDAFLKEQEKKIDRISNRIERMTNKENRLVELIEKKTREYNELKRDVKSLSIDADKLRDSIFVHKGFTPDINMWSKNISGVFGVTLDGITEKPFYYIVSNNPKKILEDMRVGVLKSKSVVLAELFDYFVDHEVAHLVKLEFQHFATSIKWGFTHNKEKICLNRNFNGNSDTQKQRREKIVSDLKKKVDNYNEID